jgi:hypothetical protein
MASSSRITIRFEPEQIRVIESVLDWADDYGVSEKVEDLLYRVRNIRRLGSDEVGLSLWEWEAVIKLLRKAQWNKEMLHENLLITELLYELVPYFTAESATLIGLYI